MSHNLMADPSMAEQARKLADQIRARRLAPEDEKHVLVGLRIAANLAVSVAEALMDQEAAMTFNVRLLQGGGDYAAAARQALAEMTALYVLIGDSVRAQRQAAQPDPKGGKGKLL